jgi:hypothetical protein
MKYSIQNCPMEWSFSSGKEYSNPFNDIELDVIFTDSDGVEMRVPTFWAGDQTWRIRYSAPRAGIYHYRTVCSDTSNSDLHGLEGKIKVANYEGDNPLLKHGTLRVAKDCRHLEHQDSTPFFWLADTWWMGFTKRLRWPQDFQLLTADRVKKGFTVIQIVAGLYPDMDQFDERGANEVGFPWERDYSKINPSYFDMADIRIQWLVKSGIVPCIVACWGYFIDFVGVDVLKKHWRNLLARYGAFPVVWCMAGEAIMPYYLAPGDKRGELIEQAKSGWTEIARYLREIDPYHHPITIHPTDCGHNQVEDPSVIDIDMLQTGHGGWDSMPNTVRQVVDSLAIEPKTPVIDGEVSYETIGGQCLQDVQRFAFWSCVLSGAAGHTYGANGIWQVNTREKPYGPSPHGMSWGNIPWEDSYQLPGSAQIGIGKSLLMRYPWWQFEPHPEWVANHATKENVRAPYCAGVPKVARIIYLPGYMAPQVKGVESDVTYRAFYVDPQNGKETDIGTVTPDNDGNWQATRPPIFQDWLLVLEKKA